MFPLIKEFQPCRWRRAHLIAESPDGFVLDYIKVEVKRRRWWDPLGLLTGKKISEAVGISFCQNHCGDPNSKWLMAIDFSTDPTYHITG